MRVAVVDDVDVDAESLVRYLDEFSGRQGVSLQVERFFSADRFLKSKTSEYALVILDIDMPGTNGVEAARILREDNPDVVIMFVTNYPNYALAGYEVEAVDYVIKPISYGEFSLKMQKALRYVGRNVERTVVIKTRDGLVNISVWELLYVESARHYLTYHTSTNSWRIRGTMTDAENELGSLGFARCNSGYLVNLRHVRGVDGDDALVGTERLRISRGRRASFLTAFARFAGGMSPRGA